MGRSAIHPGEHLAEQLEELDMSAAELARQLKVPTNRITEILNGQRRRDRGHGLAPRAFLRDQPGILAEPAKALRTAPGRAKIRGNHQRIADPRQAMKTQSEDSQAQSR